MSVTADGSLPEVPASEAPAARSGPRGSGFWAVAFAFLVVMAVATLPSPLYGLYRTRDHLSAFTITVVFAIFAGSTIGVLQGDSSVAARLGRRGMMPAAVATMMLAMAVLAVWKDLPGLLIGRLVESRVVPDRGRADRRGFRSRLQGDVRDRARGEPAGSRVAMTSDLLIALYVGLAVPVIGAGVALDLGASAPNTVLGFAILVGLGVVVSGWALLGRRP